MTFNTEGSFLSLYQGPSVVILCKSDPWRSLVEGEMKAIIDTKVKKFLLVPFMKCILYLDIIYQNPQLSNYAYTSLHLFL